MRTDPVTLVIQQATMRTLGFAVSMELIAGHCEVLRAANGSINRIIPHGTKASELSDTQVISGFIHGAVRQEDRNLLDEFGYCTVMIYAFSE